jgi:hypothetical protein
LKIGFWQSFTELRPWHNCPWPNFPIIFKSALPPYKNALNKSGYDVNFTYETENRNRTQKRKRNITWFNPPYSANVSTNIGAKFLRMIDSCFPPEHILHKSINRNKLGWAEPHSRFPLSFPLISPSELFSLILYSMFWSHLLSDLRSSSIKGHLYLNVEFVVVTLV